MLFHQLTNQFFAFKWVQSKIGTTALGIVVGKIAENVVPMQSMKVSGFYLVDWWSIYSYISTQLVFGWPKVGYFKVVIRKCDDSHMKHVVLLICLHIQTTFEF